jgi:hypothetical protein
MGCGQCNACCNAAGHCSAGAGPASLKHFATLCHPPSLPLMQIKALDEEDDSSTDEEEEESWVQKF